MRQVAHAFARTIRLLAAPKKRFTLPNSLTEYALRLSEDPAELARFQSSPGAARAAMDAAGLSAEHQETLLGGDQQRIGAALTADARTLVAEPMEAKPGDEPMEAPEDEPLEAPEEKPIEEPDVHEEPMEAKMETHQSAILA
jgi:hypothetical protein